MAVSRTEDTKSILEKLPEEIIGEIKTGLTLKDISSIAQTNKKLKKTIYKTFTLFTDPNTEKKITHKQAIRYYSRYTEINHSLEHYKTTPLSEYYLSLNLGFDKNIISVLKYSCSSAIIAEIAFSLYLSNYELDTASCDQVMRQGMGLSITAFLAITSAFLYKYREGIKF